jgi:hypothetical protein
VPSNNLPEGVRDAKSREGLQATGKWLQSLLPQDMDNYLSNLFQTVFKKQPKGNDQDAPEAPPGKRSDGRNPVGSPNVTDQAGYDRSDRKDLRQLIQGTTR